MAEKAPAAPTISDMLAALSQLGNLSRALNHAQTLVDGLANAEQVGKELAAAITAKRTELAKSTDEIVEKAKRDAREAAAEIIADAKLEAAKIIGEAKAREDRHDEAVAAKQAEHDAISAKLAELRKHAASLAG